MIRVALKNLLARKMRLILISLLVVAGVAFVSGTFVLTDTLANMGIDTEDKTIRQCLAETPNCAVRISVAHRSSEDGQQIFAEVKRTLPLTD